MVSIDRAPDGGETRPAGQRPEDLPGGMVPAILPLRDLPATGTGLWLSVRGNGLLAERLPVPRVAFGGAGAGTLGAFLRGTDLPAMLRSVPLEGLRFRISGFLALPRGSHRVGLRCGGAGALTLDGRAMDAAEPLAFAGGLYPLEIDWQGRAGDGLALEVDGLSVREDALFRRLGDVVRGAGTRRPFAGFHPSWGGGGAGLRAPAIAPRIAAHAEAGAEALAPAAWPAAGTLVFRMRREPAAAAPMALATLADEGGGFALWTDREGRLRARLGDRTVTRFVEDVEGTIRPGAWHHVALTWSEEALALHLDGILADMSDGLGAGLAAVRAAARLGRAGAARWAFSGVLGPVALLDAPASAVELARLAAAEDIRDLARFAPGAEPGAAAPDPRPGPR